MAQDFATSYAAITKSERQADGTLKVYGKATDDSIDIDLQICDENWLKNAMPQWFETGGNIREQHSNIAAGVATDYELKADGHYITAHVVDPTSVKKVEAGVLKGFSIGIRSPRVIRDNKAANGRIVDGQIVEVSLVDRPANPNAKLMLAKAAENGELMAVTQTNIPTPAELFAAKSDSPFAAIVDAAADAVDAVAEVVENVADAVAEAAETVADVAHDVADKAEEVADEVEQVADAVDAEKSTTADIVKGDVDLYNAAVSAVAALIKSETDEIVAGEDEVKDIKCLLKAMKHLQKWHSIEADKGEVPVIPSDDAHDEMIEAEEMVLELAADKSAAPNFAVDDIIEKAVKSARDAVESEIEQLKEVAKSLEAERDAALLKSVAGGPARAGFSKTPKHDTNELLAKANEYRAKAAGTEDRFLAEGYLELADDLEIKARKA
jgi:phage head maturation protease